VVSFYGASAIVEANSGSFYATGVPLYRWIYHARCTRSVSTVTTRVSRTPFVCKYDAARVSVYSTCGNLHVAPTDRAFRRPFLLFEGGGTLLSVLVEGGGTLLSGLFEGGGSY